jgi:hypothetical protein
MVTRKMARDQAKGSDMAKGNDGDRYVVKHEDGWAVKKEHNESSAKDKR